MHNITWIGNNLGITDDKGGLEATQKGDFTVINVGTEENNPKADIIAPLPLFSVDSNILDKLSTVIEEIVKESSGTKSKVVVHDVFGIERSGLVAAWTIHKAIFCKVQSGWSFLRVATLPLLSPILPTLS